MRAGSPPVPQVECIAQCLSQSGPNPANFKIWGRPPLHFLIDFPKWVKEHIIVSTHLFILGEKRVEMWHY